MSAAEGRTVEHLLEQGIERMGLSIDASRRELLAAFIGLLARWNRAYNLTAVRDPAEMVPRHVLDSIAVCPYLGGGPVLDLGTGAGLPGIPLAAIRPDLNFVLLDANGKKVRFVRQAALELGLDNVSAVQARMESYRPEQKFATIVSRAVTGLSELAAVSNRLLLPGGHLLLMKGRFPHDELAARGAPDAVVHRLDVPFLDGERHLLEILHH